MFFCPTNLQDVFKHTPRVLDDINAISSKVLPTNWHLFKLKAMLFSNNKQLNIESTGKGASFVGALRIINIEMIKNDTRFFTKKLKAALSISNIKPSESARNEIKSVTDDFTIPFCMNSLSVNFA